jgi:hypothetical protein
MCIFQSEIASIGTDSNNSNEMGANSPSSMISGASPVLQSPVPNCSSTSTTAATTTTSSSLTQNHDSTPAEFQDKKKQNDHNNSKVTVRCHLYYITCDKIVFQFKILFYFILSSQ